MKITQTNVNDFKTGQRDKKAGYYDKWYRYNRADEGEAYDSGQASAECKKAKGVQIIPCSY